MKALFFDGPSPVALPSQWNSLIVIERNELSGQCQGTRFKELDTWEERRGNSRPAARLFPSKQVFKRVFLTLLWLDERML